MNKKLPLFTVAIVATSILFLGNSNGRTGTGNDSTGGCSCHGSGNPNTFQVSNVVEVFNAGTSTAATSYVPGQSYTVKVTVNKTGALTPAGYGLQMKATTGGSTFISTWVNPSTSAKISTGTVGGVNGKKFVEHSNSNTSNIFTCDFVAPASGSGPIAITVATMGNNGTGTTGGDAASTTTSRSLTEGTSSVVEPTELSFKLFPNPTSDVLSLELNGSISGNTMLNIVDVTGRVMASQMLFPGINSVPVAKLGQGTYMVQVIENGKTVKSSSFVKL